MDISKSDTANLVVVESVQRRFWPRANVFFRHGALLYEDESLKDHCMKWSVARLGDIEEHLDVRPTMKNHSQCPRSQHWKTTRKTKKHGGDMVGQWRANMVGQWRASSPPKDSHQQSLPIYFKSLSS